MTYDSIADQFDVLRHPDIGVGDLLALVQSFARPPAILDLGCGTGFPIAKALVGRAGRYLGIDHSQRMCALFRQRLPAAECRCGELDDLDDLAGPFDLIFSWGALCHLTPDRQRRAMLGAARLLGEDGLLAFTGGGEEAGSCQGRVGPLVVHHHSLGREGYITAAAEAGLALRSSGYGSGGNHLYVFTRSLHRRPAL